MSVLRFSHYSNFVRQNLGLISLSLVLVITSFYIVDFDGISIFELYQQRTAWAQTSEDLFPNATDTGILGNRSVIPGIHVMSLINEVKSTWIIISSDTELSVNLRYIGNNVTTPAVSLLATALKTVTNLTSQSQSGAAFERLTGTNVTQSGWISPMTVPLQLQGSSSLYDADLIVVMIVPYTGQPLLTNTTDTTTMSMVPQLQS